MFLANAHIGNLCMLSVRQEYGDFYFLNSFLFFYFLTTLQTNVIVTYHFQKSTPFFVFNFHCELLALKILDNVSPCCSF